MPSACPSVQQDTLSIARPPADRTRMGAVRRSSTQSVVPGLGSTDSWSSAGSGCS
jgi:hypothetical protein